MDTLQVHDGNAHSRGLIAITMQQSQIYKRLGLIQGKKLCCICPLSVISFPIGHTVMQDKMMIQFSVGKYVNDVCSDDTRHYIYYLSDDELLCLPLRQGCATLTSICHLHYQCFSKLCSANQQRCCDPLQVHESSIHSKGLRAITT